MTAPEPRRRPPAMVPARPGVRIGWRPDAPTVPSRGLPLPPRPVLDVAGVTLRVGGLVCLAGVSLRQQRETVLAVIGPNGAGKTSLLDCLCGARRPGGGSARFWPGRRAGGRGGPTGGPVELFGRSAPAVARLGIARTFRGSALFGGLTVLDNVRVGVEAAARGHSRRPSPAAWWARREAGPAASAAWDLLELVGLADRAGVRADRLSPGERTRVAIARALGTRPALLVLDEPAAGASGADRAWLADFVGQLRADGLSVLLAEHDARLALAVADTVVVLAAGAVVATGPPADVRGVWPSTGRERGR